MAASNAKLEEIQRETTPRPSKSISTTPSSGYSYEADNLPLFEPNRLFPGDSLEFQRQEILQKHEDTVIRYNNCFVCLQQAFSEVNALREENLMLRAKNIELMKLLVGKEDEIMTSLSGLPSVMSDFRRIGLSAQGESGREVAGERNQNTSGITGREEDSGEPNTLTRGVLPKIISIRSSGFVAKSNQAAGGSSGLKGDEANVPHRLRVAAGGNPAQGEEGEGIELEVYNQGMLKTELCNKWEETMSCPYEERCQFAHGIEELRPVIRHPRYKTEICRMINSGGTCPYGHRCHFRHALLPVEEKDLGLLL